MHACYECLLGEKEQPLLQEIKKLVLRRKSMHLAEQEGYDNDKRFSELLRMDMSPHVLFIKAKC